MRFEQTHAVSHPAHEVLSILIDRIEVLVPFLANIEGVRLEGLEDRGGGTIHILRRWQGTPDGLPALIRPFVSREMLAWLDDATWLLGEHKVHWEIRSSLGRLYSCSGTNYFEPHPEDPASRTRVRIYGELKIHPEVIPGLPAFIAEPIASRIERMIVRTMEPDLAQLAVALQQCLDAQKGETNESLA